MFWLKPLPLKTTSPGMGQAEMSWMMAGIFSSALPAVRFAEPGADAVRSRLRHGVIAAVNGSETLGRAVDRGIPLEIAGSAVSRLELVVIPFDAESAARAAPPRGVTRPRGLSFADRAWAHLDVGVTVTQIR